MSRFSNRCIQNTMILLIMLLIINTVLGLVWLVKVRKENEDYLKTRYFVESIILLAIPIGIAVFFIIVIFVVIGIMYYDTRRNMRHRRMEDDGIIDFEEIE